MMSTTTAVLATDYRRVLREVWTGDKSLVGRFHANAPCSLAWAVRESAAVLRAAPGLRFYALYDGAALYGFFGVQRDTNTLLTFGLHTAYRTPAWKESLWQHIRTFTDAGRPLVCTLHARNARARRFIEAAGAELVCAVRQGTQLGVMYHLNLSPPCHSS